MKLYLLRHGQAEPLAASDAERQLTAVGEAGSKSAAESLIKRLQEADAHLCHLLHSPFVRTTQTKEQVVEVLRSSGLSVPSTPCDALLSETLPEHAAQAIDACLQSFVGENSSPPIALLAVTHQPLVSRLVSWLVDGDGSSRAAMQYPMSPSSLACLEFETLARGTATFEGLLHHGD